MNRKTPFIVLILLIGCCISCKSNLVKTKRSESNKNELNWRSDSIFDSIRYARYQKAGLEYDREWHKIMENSENQAKEIWKKDFADQFIYGELKISDKDRENAKSIIIESYRIRVSSLLKWDTATSVHNIMTLCKDTAIFCVYPNGHNPYQVHYAYREGKLNWIRTFGILVYSSQISELYFKRHLPFINVVVGDGNHGWQFIVFIDENGELMLTQFGYITPFKDVLKSYSYPNKRMEGYFN